MTPENRIIYNAQFAKTVYALLKTRFDGTAEERTAIAATLLDEYTDATGTRPANNIVERLADYILGGDPSFLSESQLKRREGREHSNPEISD